MQGIHHRLRELQGQAEPLSVIAQQVARDTRLLCLDEFHITDIGDAMLMRGLLEGLFELGVVLVTTSNQHPDELYQHGLQRAQFLPAIELLKGNLEVHAARWGQRLPPALIGARRRVPLSVGRACASGRLNRPS